MGRYARAATVCVAAWSAIALLGSARLAAQTPGELPPPGPALRPPEMIPPGSSAGVLPPPGATLRQPEAVPPGKPSAPAVPQETIVDVRVVGNETVPLPLIVKEIKTRADRPFDPVLVEEDVRRLNKTRKFVTVDANFQRNDKGLVVVFRVVERPTLRYVKYVGHTVRQSTIEKQTSLKAGDALDPYMIVEARRKLEEWYQTKGYSKAKVTIVEGDKAGDRGAVFLINEGQKQRVFKVQFVGNTIATDARLRTQIQTKKPFLYLFKGEVDRQKIDDDVDKLTTYYRSLGFFRARIGRELEFNEKESWLTLTFVIDEGPRYKVRDVAVIGNKKFQSAELMDELKLTGGKYFDQLTMTRDVTMIQDKYGSVGYIFAAVEADPRFLEEPGQLDLIYQIQEGARYRVGRIDVNIAGEHPRTRRHTILNRVDIHPGDIADNRKLRDSERRLKASGLFANDPQNGKVPTITWKRPEFESLEAGFAERPGQGPNVRGQSPDDYPPGYPPPWTPPPGSTDRVINVSYEEHTTYRPSSDQESSDTGLIVRGQSPGLPWEDYRRPTTTAPTTNATQPYNTAQPYRAAQPMATAPPAQPGTGYGQQWGPAPANAYAPNAQPQVLPSQPQAWPANSAAVGQVPLRRAGPDSTSGYGSTAPQPQGSNPIVQVQYTQPANPAYSNAATPAYGQPSVSQPAYAQPAPYNPLNPVQPAYGAPQPGYGGVMPAQGFGTTQPPVVGATPQGVLPPPEGIGAANPDELFPPGGYPFLQGDEPTAVTNVDIGVDETQTGRFMLGVGVNSNAGLVGSITLDEQNFDWRRFPRSWEEVRNATAWRGGGQQLRLEAVPGTVVSRYAATFREPYLFDTNIALSLSGFFFNRFYQNWTEQRGGGRVGLGYSLTPDLSTSVALRAEDVNISNPTVPTPQAVTDVLGSNGLYTVALNVAHDTRDSPFLPTQGHFINFGFEQAFGNFHYPRLTLEGRQYFLLRERPDRSGRHVLELFSTVGFSDVGTPVFENFFAGGYGTLRGFYFRGASPLDLGVQVGGRFQWLNTVEYMFPITADDMIRGVMFCDFGTVEPTVQLKGDSFRVAPGLGLRITIPAMGPAPIALDFAVPVNYANGDTLQTFSFFVGAAR